MLPLCILHAIQHTGWPLYAIQHALASIQHALASTADLGRRGEAGRLVGQDEPLLEHVLTLVRGQGGAGGL